MAERIREDLIRYDHPQFTLDIQGRRLIIEGTVVSLTPREFSVLDVLRRNINRIVFPEIISYEIWGNTKKGSRVRGYVMNLRRKIDHGRNLESPILSRRGFGCILDDPTQLGH